MFCDGFHAFCDGFVCFCLFSLVFMSCDRADCRAHACFSLACESARFDYKVCGNFVSFVWLLQFAEIYYGFATQYIQLPTTHYSKKQATVCCFGMVNFLPCAALLYNIGCVE